MPLAPLDAVSLTKELGIGTTKDKKTHSIGGTTPLQSQTKTDDPREQGEQAQGIELPQFILEENLGIRAVRDFEQEEGGYQDHTS